MRLGRRFANCIMGLFWGSYRFFHWLSRGWVGNWVKTVPPCNSHSRPQSLLGAWARAPWGSGDTGFEVLDFRSLEMTGSPKILCPQSLLVLVLRPPGGSGDENVQFHTTRTQSHAQPRSGSFCKKKKKKLKSKSKIKKKRTLGRQVFWGPGFRLKSYSSSSNRLRAVLQDLVDSTDRSWFYFPV